MINMLLDGMDSVIDILFMQNAMCPSIVSLDTC